MSTLTSSFAPHIEAMLQWRASLGHSPRDLTSALAGFDRFCSARHPGETVLTRELATAWCLDAATGTGARPDNRAVRELGKYLQRPAWTPSSCRPRRGSRPGRNGACRTCSPTRSWPRSSGPLTPSPPSTAARSASTRSGRLPAAPQYGAAPDRGPPPAPPRRRHRERGADDRAVQAEQGPQCPPRRGPGRAAGPLRPAGGPAAPGPGVVLPRQERTPADPAVADRRLPPVLRAGRGDRPGIDSLRAPAQLRGPHANALGRGGRDLESWLPYLGACMGHEKYCSTAWYVHLLPERLAAAGLNSAAGIIPAVAS